MDQTQPGVKITLDRERTLLLDLNGMRAYQKAIGKSPLGSRGIDLNNVDDLQAILWASLIREDPQLKLEEVAPWVTIENVRLIQLRLIDALGIAFPAAGETEAAAGDSPLAKGPPAGSTSGPAVVTTSGSMSKSSGN